MTRWDRTKDQMIRRFNMRQCIRTTALVLRTCVSSCKFSYDPKGGGGYIYRLFRRFLVDIIDCKRRYHPRRRQKRQPKIKVDCGLKQIWLFSLHCISKLFAPVLFLLISLFLSVSRLRLQLRIFRRFLHLETCFASNFVLYIRTFITSLLFFKRRARNSKYFFFQK